MEDINKIFIMIYKFRPSETYTENINSTMWWFLLSQTSRPHASAIYRSPLYTYFIDASTSIENGRIIKPLHSRSHNFTVIHDPLQ